MMNESASPLSRWPSVAGGVLLVAMALTALCSWLGSRYGFPLQNLLGTDGLRWLLRHVLPDFCSSPVASVFVLLMGAGVAVRAGLVKALSSGILHLCRPVAHPVRLSLRQRRALLLAGCVAGIYAALVAMGLYGAHGFLLGIKGGLAHSPFVEGLPLLLSVGVGLVGGIYGFSAGRLQTGGDLLQGAAVLVSRAAPAFVLMFLGSVWLSMLDYTAMSLLLRVEYGSWGRLLIECLIFWGFPLVSVLKK